MGRQRKVLIKDLVIPKGTVFDEAPARTERAGDDHYQAIFGLSKDSSGVIEYCIDPSDPELEEWFADLKE